MSDGDVVQGDGYAISNLDELGSGPGFRKVRRALDVTAFGVNAIVYPPDIEPGLHAHERQEELYFVHAGRVALEFGDGTRHELGPGGLARVDAATFRRVVNVGDEEAVVLIVGGEGGYVGRDAYLAPGDERMRTG
jgi:mannose-6-phosphate isomerase-like protein (cupin superfamily)